MVHLSEPHTLKIPLAKKSKHSYLSLVKVRGGWFWFRITEPQKELGWKGPLKVTYPKCSAMSRHSYVRTRNRHISQENSTFLTDLVYIFMCGCLCGYSHTPIHKNLQSETFPQVKSCAAPQKCKENAVCKQEQRFLKFLSCTWNCDNIIVYNYMCNMQMHTHRCVFLYIHMYIYG